MLKHITLNNFKKLEYFDSPINVGVTAIVGENDRGKSTILKAIMFAIRGTTAVGKAKNIWKWGAKGKRSVALKLDLPVYGTVTITRTPSGATVFNKQGENLASGDTAVNKFIEEALGVQLKVLQQMVYSKQNETNELLEMGPTILQKQIESLSKADVIDNVLNQIKDDLLVLAGKMSGFPNESEVDGLHMSMALLEPEKVKVKEELATTQTYLESVVTPALDTASKAYQEALAIHDKREQLKDLINRNTPKLDQTKREAAKVEAELAQLPALLTDEQELELHNEIIASDNIIKAISNTITVSTNIERARDRLMTQISMLEVKANKHLLVSERVKAIQHLLSKVEIEVSTLETKAKLQWVRLQDLKLLLHSSVCSLCKQPVKELTTEQITSIEKEIVELAEEHDYTLAEAKPVNARLTELKKELAFYSRDIDDSAAQLLTNTYLELNKLPETVENISELDEQRQRLHAQLFAYEKQISNNKVNAANYAGKEQYLDSCLKHLDTLRTEHQLLFDQLMMLPVVDLVPLQEELKTQQQTFKQVQQALTDCTIREAKINEQFQSMVLALEKAEKIEAERIATQKELTVREQLQKYLKANRTKWGSELWGGLLGYTSQLIEQITDGELSNLSRSDDGEFTVAKAEHEGLEIPVTETSGVQQAIVSTALKIAMSRIFYGENLFLLLDEISSAATDKTSAAIAGMLKSLNMQILMVTLNREGDALMVDNVIDMGD